MTKKEAVAALATKLGESQKQAAMIWDAVWAVAADAITDGGLRVENFGSFTLKAKPQRTRRDPRTGDPVDVPAHNAVGFKPSVHLKGRANGQ